MKVSRGMDLLRRAPRSTQWRALITVLLGCSALVALEAPAATEYEAKAAFILNFIRFTEWPREAFKDNQFRLCVLGRDPFREAIEPLQGKIVHNRALLVRRLTAVREATGCHALFVAESEDTRLEAVLSALASQPVLIVGDMEQFAERGGVIALRLVDERIRFDVNLGAARTHGLRVSSQVLKLAQRVVDSKGAP